MIRRQGGTTRCGVNEMVEEQYPHFVCYKTDTVLSVNHWSGTIRENRTDVICDQ